MLPASISELEALPPLHRSGLDECAQLAPLLTGLLAWIVAYERAVEAGPGLDYRAACLAHWSRQKLAMPADALVKGWETFAHDCAAALTADTAI